MITGITKLKIEDGDIVVLHLGKLPAEATTITDYQAIVHSFCPTKCSVMILSGEQTIQSLNEEELRRVGLMKVPAENIPAENPR